MSASPAPPQITAAGAPTSPGEAYHGIQSEYTHTTGVDTNARHGAAALPPWQSYSPAQPVPSDAELRARYDQQMQMQQQIMMQQHMQQQQQQHQYQLQSPAHSPSQSPPASYYPQQQQWYPSGPTPFFPTDPVLAMQHAHAHAAAAAAAAAAVGAPHGSYSQHTMPPSAVPPHMAAMSPMSSMPPPTPTSFDPLRMHQLGHGQPSQSSSWGPSMQLPATLPQTPYAGAASSYVDPYGSPTPAAAVPPPSDGAAFDAEAELLFLQKVERKARSLQNKGHHLYALELMEQSVASRTLLYGALSPEVRAASEQLGLLYNSLAMASLYREEYKPALRLLRKAELLTSQMSELTSVRVQSLNNLACCYRRLARPKTALNLLRESLVLLSAERVPGGDEGRPVTHLNMCAILSQLARHEEALEHAKAAVMHCQKQLLQHPQPEQSRADAAAAARKRHGWRHHGDEEDGHSDGGQSDVSSVAPTAAAALSLSHQQLSEKIVLLGIAYHNLGVEEEFLSRFDLALDWYTKAVSLAREQLGPEEEVTKTFQRSLEAARAQVEQLHRAQSEARKRATHEFQLQQQQMQDTTRFHGIGGGQQPRRAASRPTSATPSATSTARSFSAARSSRPSSAAPSRSSSISASRARQSYAAPAAHSASQADFFKQSQPQHQPSYASSTSGSSSRVRPKSASVSRPPRPGR